jgi:AraC-like DNA-binding protein
MADESLPTSGTIASLQLMTLVSVMDALGVDGSHVLSKIGMPRERIREPAGRQCVELQFALWEAAVVVSGDPAIGLRVGQQLAREALERKRNCAWLKSVTSVRELLRFDGLPLQLDERAMLEPRGACEPADRTRLTLSCGEQPLPDQTIDCVFSALFAGIRHVFPRTPLSDFSARIAHRALSPVATYEHYLGCKVALDAGQHAIEGPRAYLEPAAVATHPEVVSRAESSAPCGRLVASVRAQLVRQLEQGCLGLSVLAQALHLSERTLRRRLSEQGTSYQLLVDELRARTACELVQAGAQSLDAISVRLGFADTSCFFHAFKRWTGKTPMQFRRERRGRGEA